MSKWLKIAVALVITTYCIAILLPIDPKDQRPGMRLSGPNGTSEQWQAILATQRNFGDNLVLFETRPWYGLRHSVTTTSLTLAGEFFVPCGWCSNKRWPTFVAADPRVRIKIDGAVFERTAVRVTDEALLAQFSGSTPDLWIYRLDTP